MSFKHGVYVTEKPTSITGQRSVDSAIPVVFGTAPKGAVNQPFVVRSYTEAVQEFGFSTDFETYTLSEFIDCHFNLYKQSYAILINVADLTKFKKTNTVVIDISDRVTVTDISYPGLDSIKLKKGTTDLVKETDYSVKLDTNGTLIISIPDGSTLTLPATELTLSYDSFDSTKLKNTDVIGGVDPNTGVRTGFELLDNIVPQLNVVPSLVLAPRHSTDPLVSSAMVAKAQSINEMFKAFALTDLDTKTIKSKQKAIEAKQTGDPGQVICWPKVVKNGRMYHISTHLACVIAQMDSDNDGVPSRAPSNRTMQVDGCVLDDGTPVFVGPSDANDLNAVGITTMLSFFGGPRSWGTRTAAFPNATDMKDNFIHAKRMMFWINNWLITDTWQEVDSEINRRFLQAVTSKHNIRLNGLTSSGAILGGSCEFDPLDNSIGQMIEGKVMFKLSVGIPGIAENITFEVGIEPKYLESLNV